MSGIISDNVLKQSGLIKASAGGAWTFLSKATASSSSDVSITSGIDDTYGTYVFTFNNIHPATDDVAFQVNFRDGSSSYDATKTTTSFRAIHDEGDGTTSLGYFTGNDVAQGTGVHLLASSIGADNDQAVSGYLYLFNPSSTTFVKHFIGVVNSISSANYTTQYFSAGYCNVTAAIDGTQFSFSSGNIDSGDICLYGITV